jgi:hypothetical protein
LGLGLLSGCAGGSEWVNPNKTAAEARADEKICTHEAEEDALLRNGHARADYGLPPAGPGPGSMGPSPMQMKDRDATTRDFHRELDSCMEGKGYSRGKSGRG